MSSFSIFINVFKTRVCKLNKRSLNIKRNLHNFYVLVLLWLVAVVAVSSSAVVCEASDPSKDASEYASVKLESLPSSDETVRLSLTTGDGVSICGMRAVVRYDPEMLKLKEVIPDEKFAGSGGVLSFADRYGEVVLVADICENYTECELGILVFETRETCRAGEVCFELQVDPMYFWDEDELVSIEPPAKEEFAVVIPDFVMDNGALGLTVETKKEGEAVALTLRAVAPSRCFAAGFDVCVVELTSLDVQGFSVLSVPGGDMAEERTFSHTLRLSLEGAYCVIIKPMIYFRGGVVSGCEVVIFIDDGLVKRNNKKAFPLLGKAFYNMSV